MNYLELLTPEKIKSLESTKNKITDENYENVPHLETTEVVLVHCNIVCNAITVDMTQESCCKKLRIFVFC